MGMRMQGVWKGQRVKYGGKCWWGVTLDKHIIKQCGYTHCACHPCLPISAKFLATKHSTAVLFIRSFSNFNAFNFFTNYINTTCYCVGLLPYEFTLFVDLIHIQ